MKLNIDILLDNLSELFPVKHYGYHSEKMSLKLWQYYYETDKFEADRIYIVSSNLLPEKPFLEEGTVIICSGGRPSPAYFSSQCALLILEAEESITSIFNIVGRIFERYEKWDIALRNITHATAKNTLDELLKSSISIFQNTLFILDNQLKVIACASPPNSSNKNDKFKINGYTSTSIEHYSHHFKDSIIIDRKKRDVYISDKFTPTLGSNLYEQENFIGGCYLQANIKPFRESDKVLLKHLSNYVLIVYKQYYNISEIDNWQKEIFTKAINGDTPQRNLQLIKEEFTHCKQNKYFCIVCKSEDDIKFVPIKYICKQIESTLLGTVAIEKDHMLVILVDLGINSQNKHPIMQKVISTLDGLGFKGGISDEFDSIKNAHSYFIQACEALEIGSLIDPESRIYYFQDYLIEYMLKIISGKPLVSMLCSKGIMKLLKHDEMNNTNYFEELRVYLKNNLNAVRTANELFIHRHTFHSHLKQIIDILQLDLDNWDDLLYLLISYKLFEFEDKLNYKKK